MRTYVLTECPADPLALDLLPYCIIFNGSARQNRERIQGRIFVEADHDCPDADINDAIWRIIEAA